VALVTAVRKLRVAATLLGAAALFSGAYTAFPAEAAPTTLRVEWLTTNTTEPTNLTVNWPQKLLREGNCGWVQPDDYRYSTPEEVAAVDKILADGILTEGEDWAVVIKPEGGWKFREIPCESARIGAAVDQSVSKRAGVLAATGGFPWWSYVPGGFALVLAGWLMFRSDKKDAGQR
jgi:hypothetical protein